MMTEFLKNIFSFDPSSPLIFTQFYFWAFFALVYAIFALVKSRRLLRNAFLAFASLFFYWKTSGVFLLILVFVTCSDFLIARRMDRCSREGRRKLWLILSVSVDLFLLCYFKYAYFFTDLINQISGLELRVFDAFAWIGNAISGSERFSVDSIVLPVGISFYIFQVISYSADVYMRKIKPVGNILDFAFYVSFFPQLVAGPIVRASEFIPQLYKPFHLSRRQFGVAVFWILNGLIKKIVLSDYIAVNFIDRVFENPLLFSSFENLAALFGYSLQVYADFSGYTDIAIGVAMLMGFYLPQNFDSPYKAPNAQNFWKRWHISLSRWLQNYLYIPLGGNRNTTFGSYFWIVTFALIALLLSGSIWALAAVLSVGAVTLLVARFLPDHRKKIIANLNSFITMLLGGLWHGASLNFVIWGGLNGVGMIIYKFWKDLSWTLRPLLLSLLTLLVFALKTFAPSPVFNLLFVWLMALLAGTLVRSLWHIFRPDSPGAFSKGTDSREARLALAGMSRGQRLTVYLGNAWAVLQTFVFITFTRLFFRSGSNLDPAEANEKAWATARNMVSQIGGEWDLSIIPDVCSAYWKVFLLVALGMLVHWLPSRFKRRYRLSFAMLPLPLMALICVLTVFLLYQFVTAGFQPFIYFQF